MDALESFKTRLDKHFFGKGLAYEYSWVDDSHQARIRQDVRRWKITHGYYKKRDPW